MLLCDCLSVFQVSFLSSLIPSLSCFISIHLFLSDYQLLYLPLSLYYASFVLNLFTICYHYLLFSIYLHTLHVYTKVQLYSWSYILSQLLNSTISPSLTFLLGYWYVVALFFDLVSSIQNCAYSILFIFLLSVLINAMVLLVRCAWIPHKFPLYIISFLYFTLT